MPSVEPGVYGFESGTNVFGRFQAGWYTSPTDRVGLLGDDHFRLPTVVVTTNHDLAVEAWQQYADRLRANRQQPAAPATTFWGGFGETMGAAWKGLAGGVRNLASDLSSPRFAQGGVNARTAASRSSDRRRSGEEPMSNARGTRVPRALFIPVTSNTRPYAQQFFQHRLLIRLRRSRPAGHILRMHESRGSRT